MLTLLMLKLGVALLVAPLAVYLMRSGATPPPAYKPMNLPPLNLPRRRGI